MTTLLTTSLTAARTVVEPALQEAVETLDPRIRRVAAYHLGWLTEDGSPVAGPGGKRLRPALALLSAEAAGRPPGQGVPAAVAVELVHNFSLLHDDIMDGDTERRHRPTAWTVFGVGPAILAGDAMLALAGEVLLDSGSPTAAWAERLLTGTTQRLVRGQVADLDFEGRDDVALPECLTMAADKTAALLACSSSLGAVLVGAPAPLVHALAQAGEELGVAFQLVDDLLGIWGAPATTGKPVLADLRSRKKSLPVVAALVSGTPAGERLRALYTRPEPLDEERGELALAAELVEEAGGRAWALAESDRRLAAALEHLASDTVPPPVAQRFADLARFVVGRDL